MMIVKLLPTRIFSRQARKPSGFLGRHVMARFFDAGNADLNTFVKELLELQENDRVLEIGFGTGTLICQMAETVTHGIVEGLDFSDAMLAKASKTNRHHIENNRVNIQKGEGSSLPYEDETFDKVCTVNTIYFWDHPQRYFREMHRVMKPGGRIVIGFRDDEQMRNFKLSRDIFTTYSLDEVLVQLTEAGFSSARIKKKQGRPIPSYCAVAAKE